MKKHRNVTHRQEALAERHLYAAVAQLRTAEECRAFFRDLCTPAEIQAMADRWAVVESLRRGLAYREVNRVTGVSLTTIGRVARFLASGNGGYTLAASRLTPAAARDSRQPSAGEARIDRAVAGGGRRGAPRTNGGARINGSASIDPSDRTGSARRTEGARHA